jgi:hypothetical protein
LNFDPKKKLLKEWIDLFKENYLLDFTLKGEKINKKLIENRIKSHCTKFNYSSEYIYLLCSKNDDELIPVYIGKSINPPNRWKSHIVKLLEGRGSYTRWKNFLLTENETAKESITLLIIPENEIVSSPIPNFPKTIGSVEYQLVSLVSDAYPNTLLNKEGNRR